MAEEKIEISGPDFRLGVPLADLVEAIPLRGHVAGEVAVAVRRGDEVFVVGGTCTHYSAPLADGIVTGEMIRCPWHHACFSLRTGEAVAAPALNPVPRWRTTLRDSHVYAGAREEADALSARGRTATGPASVIIVGAGAAGSAAAEMLRRQGYSGPVLLIDPDAEAPYDRPNLSKDFLAGTAPEEWLPLRDSNFYAEHGIERIVAAVTAIDTVSRTVTISTGATLQYGALLLATGASPVRLPLPGSDRSHVHVLRSLSDCRALIAAAATAERAVVIGASFIGLESAAALRTRGLEVTVVGRELVPFERSLGAELGHRFRGIHETHGVQFRLGQTASAIHDHAVTLDSGEVLEADLVLLGVGVRPSLDVAASAGVADADGVPVDAFLETRASDVYAAGDIAKFPYARAGSRVRIEHWVVAQRQGQTAALNILGHSVRFDAVPFFWTHQYDLRLSYVGYTRVWDDVEIGDGSGNHDRIYRYIRDGAVVAAATIGSDIASLQTEIELENDRRSGGSGVPLSRVGSA